MTILAVITASGYEMKPGQNKDGLKMAGCRFTQRIAMFIDVAGAHSCTANASTTFSIFIPLEAFTAMISFPEIFSRRAAISSF